MAKYKKRFKCLVDDCEHVTKTISGIGCHLRRHHDAGLIAGENYEATSLPVTNPNHNGPFKNGKRKKVTQRRRKANGTLITEKTRFIDVPCVLRVSISGLKVQQLSLS